MPIDYGNKSSKRRCVFKKKQGLHMGKVMDVINSYENQIALYEERHKDLLQRLEEYKDITKRSFDIQRNLYEQQINELGKRAEEELDHISKKADEIEKKIPKPKKNTLPKKVVTTSKSIKPWK